MEGPHLNREGRLGSCKAVKVRISSSSNSGSLGFEGEGRL
jgi:hypothetical protein